MPALDIPFFGTLVLCLILVSASYTMAVAMGAGQGRPHLLPSARWGTYATCALVLVAVCVLAYAFQVHDFRIRYVARYSDRSMPWWYLISSLWGGQDGSLLWWAFLLAGYTFFATRWLRGRHTELQPWIIATLMSILIFFVILMLFAANPFATYIRTTPGDGEGLNPLLQNYWMAIHPPSLYMGFVGWSVPFAILIAALITGRLGNEWVRAARLWSMIAWTFLSLGLLLGCLWSYEELGWGGYWAWDPVENASFLPWLVGTAYLHSVLIQERRHMMRVWNVFLLALTFFLTIFGTFLTRSGLIASVHSFARSDIGQYFVWYMGFLIIGIAALIIWRLPKLKADNEIESLMSREFAFLLNNWVLLGMMMFVLIATTFPLLSQWLRGEEVTVGPGFYNKWMAPLGLVLLFLAGLGCPSRFCKCSSEPASGTHPSSSPPRSTTQPRALSSLGCPPWRRSFRLPPAGSCLRASARSFGAACGFACGRARTQVPRSFGSRPRDAVAMAGTSFTWASCSCTSASPARPTTSSRKARFVPARRCRSATTRCATTSPAWRPTRTSG
jgi:cytochrome c-type biogenesis protein CcmF